MKRKYNEPWPALIGRIYNMAALLPHFVRTLTPDTGTDDVEVLPATEEERAEEIAKPDVAEGLDQP